MRFSATLLAVLAEAAAVASQDVPKPASDGRYTIWAAGIKAQFIPYGATLTNLFVKDKNGKDVDVVLGYDDAAYYPKDPGHPVYNSIPGRYVNRIGNGMYKMGGKTYNTELNDGNNTLHSGTNNWSYRVWNVSAVTNTSITFTFSDPSYSEKGLPGLVLSNVTYTVDGSTLDIKMAATAPETTTPLMLTHHTYFNLDAYKNPATPLIWNHTLSMPYSKRYLEADEGALPTGKILTASAGSINDFASKTGMPFGHAQSDPKFKGNCGANGVCEGYNGYFLIDDAPKDAAVVTLASSFSGIKADLRTSAPGVVIYSCSWMDGTASLKSTQGLSSSQKVVKSSCVAIEAQDYVDGINHPEWNRTSAQFTGPGQAYNWHSAWTFGLL